MAWEERAGRLYYYQKIRDGSRVISKYVGRGLTAVLASALDQAEQDQRRRAREQRYEYDADLDAAEHHIKRLNSAVLALFRVTLLVSGFHCHKGQWRKVRYV